MSRYVQHISGQGEKYLVNAVGLEDHGDVWFVFRASSKNNLWLPKSEYREVAAPQVWVDVTDKCEIEGQSIMLSFYRGDARYAIAECLCHYRLRKVDLKEVADGETYPKILYFEGKPLTSAFIVERKEP